MATKLAVESLLIALSFLLAFVIRFDGDISSHYLEVYLALTPGLVLIRLLANYAVSRYRSPWRFASICDAAPVLQSTTIGSAVFVAVLLSLRAFHVPRGVLVIEWFLTATLLLVVRAAARVYWSRASVKNRTDGPVRRVLVVGAGDGGSKIVRLMKEDGVARLRPVGFVDDDRRKTNTVILGVRVLGTTEDIPDLVERHHVDQVLIAIPSLPGNRVGEIIRCCSKTKAELTILPPLAQILSHGLSTNRIRKVRVEDLLERTPIQVNMETIARYVAGQRVLVTGAGGSIGSELCRQILSYGPAELILVGHGENSIFWIERELRGDYDCEPKMIIADIKDRNRLETVFRDHRPTVVFHAAAHKHVPLMEANPEEAVKNNIFGTKNLAELSIRHGVRTFVMISTDKAVNPTSVMGASKRVAEMVVQSLAQRIEMARQGKRPLSIWGFETIEPRDAVTTFASVRFGNVLGSRGSVVLTMQHQIERGLPVTVTHPEMVRYFMTIPEAVQLVIQAGAMGRHGEVFVLDMGRPVKIMDLACNLIRLNGLIPEVDIPINVTGIRPGEKLYEEVLTDEEGITATDHDKIRMARPSRIDHESLYHGLRLLTEAVHNNDAEDVKRILARLVPTYGPEGSKRKSVPPVAIAHPQIDRADEPALPTVDDEMRDLNASDVQFRPLR
jgi:FlaA1/EpsC-like NDP-sugar epimerase